MHSQLNHLVALEQISDMHRAAERSQLAADARRQPRTRVPLERKPRLSFSWLGLRRRPKVA
jgi:hypothetical protein